MHDIRRQSLNIRRSCPVPRRHCEEAWAAAVATLAHLLDEDKAAQSDPPDKVRLH
jgi:hypothetical protein